MNKTISSNSAASRSIELLEALSSHKRPVSVQELALELEVPRQSAHRLVTQLESLDLISREPGSERFSIGSRMRSLALSCMSNYLQTSASHGVLTVLVGTVGETCNVGMLDGNQVFYLDRVECDWPLRVQLRAGSRVPAYCTAIGKLLLAFSDKDTRAKLLAGTDLQQLTDNTITDPNLLESVFEEIRSKDFSINNEEDSVGLIAIAVPIRDTSGKVIAGLGVHAPTARMPVERAKGLLPKIRASAEMISKYGM
ncbi:MAG: IclR family transcriptional regulator [Roseobacter sp.]